jgi:hypothetical protein
MKLIRPLLFPLIFSAASCYKPSTCQVYKKRFYSKETNIIVLDKGPIGNVFIVKGLNPITSEETVYTDIDGIYNYLYNNLELGDTIIKTKSSATFIIKKKKSNILIAYNCLNSVHTGVGKLDTIPEFTYGKMIIDTIPKSNLH